MNIKVARKIGDVLYTFDVSEKTDMASLHTAIVLANPPLFCNAENEKGKCGNTENFRLDSNKDKDGNIYVNCICKKCGAKAKLGQYKSGGYFWHKYEHFKKGVSSAPKPTEADVYSVSEEEGDIGF